MPTANPFKPAAEAKPLVRALFYGPSGIGKTWAALTVPGHIAYIDCEGSSLHYAGRPGLSPFDRILTKSYREAKAAVDYLAANPGDYTALVIDPLSVLYETLQDTAQVRRAQRRQDPEADLEMLDWGRIKRSYKSLLTAAVNLPMHLIVIARQKDEVEKKGDEMVKTGVKFDAEKSTDYWLDTVLRFGKAREGDPSADGVIRAVIVEKDRAAGHPIGSVITNPTFERIFGDYLKGKGGAAIAIPDAAVTAAADAADEDGEVGKPTPLQVAALVEALTAAQQDPAAILATQQSKHPEWKTWSDVPVVQVLALTERAQKAAAAVASSEAASGTAGTDEASASEPSDAAEAGGVTLSPSASAPSPELVSAGA